MKENPTMRSHRRQSFWQIIFPVLMALLLLIAAAILITGAEAGESRLWTDIALVWLIAPMLILSLIFLAVLSGLIYLLSRLTKGIPPLGEKAQGIFQQVNLWTTRVGNILIKPLLFLSRAGNILKDTFSSLMHR